MAFKLRGWVVGEFGSSPFTVAQNVELLLENR